MGPAMPDLTLAEVVREIKSLRIPSDKFLRIQADQVDWMKSWNEALGRALVRLARVEPAVPTGAEREALAVECERQKRLLEEQPVRKTPDAVLMSNWLHQGTMLLLGRVSLALMAAQEPTKGRTT